MRFDLRPVLAICTVFVLLLGLGLGSARAGERWVAQVGESVAVGSGALQVLTAALEPVSGVSASVLLADLALLEPSIQVALLEKALRSA